MGNGSSAVRVDVANPGQFFACCGLLELAHRLWPGAEGWFDPRNDLFHLRAPNSSTGEDVLRTVLWCLAKCEILSPSEEETESKILKQKGTSSMQEEKERTKQRGQRAQSGSIHLGKPFNLPLDWWWQGPENRKSEAKQGSLKTWAGRQQIDEMVKAAQKSLSNILDQSENLLDLFDYSTEATDYPSGGATRSKPVVLFYFDARRYCHSLKVGFSVDEQQLIVPEYPAVELLAFVGIQRFGARRNGESKYFSVWHRPLSAPLAAAVAHGLIPLPGRQVYRFRLLFRDDKKRYKAFSAADLIRQEEAP